MKIRTFLLLAVFFSFGAIMAQDVTTVEAKSEDISDHLDLEAVASLFADAQTLEDFEKALNDPDSRISNLDLNQDGYVDYLRVLENVKENAHLITIQAVIGKDLYQDVATIDVEKDKSGKTRVQVVGDVYLYGPHYIIEPVYVRPPIIFTFFWGPRWRVWHSPYYWDYYPSYWSYWNPYPYHVYYTHIHTHHIHSYHSYHYVRTRTSNACVSMHRQVTRKDYERQYPERSFASRNEKVTNKYELDKNRGIERLAKPVKADAAPATGKEVRNDWQPSSEKEGRPTTVKDNKVVVPSKDRPTNINTKEEPVIRPTKEEPVSRPSKEEPVSRPSKEEPRTKPSIEKEPAVKEKAPAPERPRSEEPRKTQETNKSDIRKDRPSSTNTNRTNTSKSSPPSRSKAPQRPQAPPSKESSPDRR